MDHDNSRSPSSLADALADGGYQSPKFEVISLDCEITAYAPDDGDTPLF